MGPLYAAKTDPVEYVRMVRKAKRRDNRDLAIIVAVLLLVSYGIVRLFF